MKTTQQRVWESDVEDYIRCLARESEEETGATAHQNTLRVRFPYGDSQHYVICPVELLPSIVPPHCWLVPESIERYLKTSTNPTIAALDNGRAGLLDRTGRRW